MKLLVALTLGLVLLAPRDLCASAIECPVASAQGRNGPDGREFILTFQIPVGLSGGDIAGGFLLFEGGFPDGIGVSAEVMSTPTPAAGALEVATLVDGVRNGTIAVAESVDGAFECGFKEVAFTSMVDGQAIEILVRPLSQSRTPTAGVEPYLATARLVLICTDEPGAQITR
ncbi:MAG: hypothetical protein SGI90_11600 [Candidatus Eisenbacteria bacterium]|nr:hypothetical protein [Candidatus Eisenbacteria bacterium]